MKHRVLCRSLRRDSRPRLSSRARLGSRHVTILAIPSRSKSESAGKAATSPRLETTDLSRGGCYIQLITPTSRGTRVQVILWLDGYPIVIPGRVVTHHPDFGNGIIFVNFQGQAEHLLQSYQQAVTT